MKQEKEALNISDSGKIAAKIKAKQKSSKKIDSYFDGYEYRGYSVKTFMVRENTEKYNPITIYNADDTYQMFKKLEDSDQERFYSVVIDGSNRVIAVYLAFQGTLNQCLVHPREIFKTAVLCSGAAVILIHNHPSGKPEPSTEDFILTQRMVEAGKIMGIEILDHVIIGYGEYFSFQKKRLLKNLN